MVGLARYKVTLSKVAHKDIIKLKSAGLEENVKELWRILADNPLQTPPPYKKLIGDLAGKYSRRINFQHRLVYQIYKDLRIVNILRMWSHYE